MRAGGELVDEASLVGLRGRVILWVPAEAPIEIEVGSCIDRTLLHELPLVAVPE